jgi:hypothetical protein
VLVTACLALFFVAVELYAHQFVTHNPWP